MLDPSRSTHVGLGVQISKKLWNNWEKSRKTCPHGKKLDDLKIYKLIQAVSCVKHKFWVCGAPLLTKSVGLVPDMSSVWTNSFK